MFFIFWGLCVASVNKKAWAQTAHAPLSDAVVQPVSDDPQFIKIASQLRCPTCVGLSALESETPQSTAMKNQIRILLAQGQSEQQILGYFEKRYGAWILRTPGTDSAIGKLVWGAPIFGFTAAATVLCWVVFKRKPHKTSSLDL